MEMKYVLMILGMTLVTFIPRYLPLAVLSKMEIPEVVIEWLKYIPAAILAALLAPGILIIDGRLMITPQNTYLLAALPTFLIAIYKRNIFLTVIVGMVMIIILNFI